MKQGRSGFTLAEIMIAMALSVLALAALVAVDSSRIRITENNRDMGGVRYPSRQEATVATLIITQRLEQGDRFCIRNGGGACVSNVAPNNQGGVLLVRRPRLPADMVGAGCNGAAVPDAVCFDNPANYQWDQISLRGTALMLFENVGAGCGAAKIIVRDQMSAANFTVNPTDPYVVSFSITWTHPTDATKRMVFPGEVAVRGRSMGMTNGQQGVMTGLQLPWSAGGGLAPPGGTCA